MAAAEICDMDPKLGCFEDILQRHHDELALKVETMLLAQEQRIASQFSSAGNGSLYCPDRSASEAAASLADDSRPMGVVRSLIPDVSDAYVEREMSVGPSASGTTTPRGAVYGNLSKFVPSKSMSATRTGTAMTTMLTVSPSCGMLQDEDDQMGALEQQDQWRRVLADAASSFRHSIDSQDNPKDLTAIPRFQWNVRRLVTCTTFEIFFAAAILSNSIFIGLSVEYASSAQGVGEQPAGFQEAQHAYTYLFLLELLLRVFAYWPSYFWNDQWRWNIFDFLIVGLSLVDLAISSWVAPAVSAERATGADNSGISNMRVLRLLRVTRLLRVLRVSRIIRFVKALHSMVYSILCTLKTLVWAMILLTMVIYLFAVLFTQAASDHLVELSFFAVSAHLPHPLDAVDDGSPHEKLYRYFGSMSASMLTLFASITGGVSWDVVIRPLHEIHFLWVVVFIAYVAFAYFAVLNVVTGVFCQSAIDAAQRDDDLALQSVISNKSLYVTQLTKLFTKIDDRQDGIITIADFERHLHDENVISFFHSLELDVSDAWSLFKLLDLDNSNNIDLDEFIMGCTRLKGNAKSIDMAQVMYDCRWLMKRFATFTLWAEERFDKLSQERFDQLDLRMASSRGMTAHASSSTARPAAIQTTAPPTSVSSPTRSGALQGARSEIKVGRAPLTL